MLLVVTFAAVTLAAGLAGAATAPTTVSVTVPSATSMDASLCQTGQAGRTSFGTVLPSTSNITSQDCEVSFGSSNDTAMLRIQQGDGYGTALFRGGTGVLDATFGVAGVRQQSFSAGADEALGVTIQPDGKIVTCGRYNTDGALVARYLPNGAIDAAFGTSGPGYTAFQVGGAGATERLLDCAIAPDGSIVADGMGANTNSMLVAKFTSTGALDTTFGSPNGFVVTDVAGLTSEQANTITTQPDGKIIVGGHGDTGGANTLDYIMARYNTDGTLDTTGFNAPTGYITIDHGGSTNRVADAAVLSTGQILFTGQGNATGGTYDFVMGRLTSAGVIDTTWASSGWVDKDFGAGSGAPEAFALAIQSDGKLLVAGQRTTGGSQQFTVYRTLADGSADGTFGTAGVASIDVSPGNGEVARSVWQAPDGSVTMAGYATSGGNDYPGIARLTSAGAADTTFSTDGLDLYTAAGTLFTNYAPEAAMGYDGRPVWAGTFEGGANDDQLLLQYDGISVPDYTGGTDWTSASVFGACLRNLTGVGATAAWTVDGNNDCTAVVGDPWNDVPATSEKVASSSTPGVTNVVADLRFGFKTAANQPAGVYTAPISLIVLAPTCAC